MHMVMNIQSIITLGRPNGQVRLKMLSLALQGKTNEIAVSVAILEGDHHFLALDPGIHLPQSSNTNYLALR